MANLTDNDRLEILDEKLRRCSYVQDLLTEGLVFKQGIRKSSARSVNEYKLVFEDDSVISVNVAFCTKSGKIFTDE